MVSNGITPPAVAGAQDSKQRPTGPAPAPMKQRLFDFRDSEVPADGQRVIVTARWILVLSGLILALWDPGPIEQMITIAAMGGLGTYYWRIQRQRRRSTRGE